MPCMGSKSPFHTWLLGSFSSKLRMLFAYDPFCSQRPLWRGGIHGTFTEFIHFFFHMALGPREPSIQCSVWHFCLQNVVYISLCFSPKLMVSRTHPCGTSTLLLCKQCFLLTGRATFTKQLGFKIKIGSVKLDPFNRPHIKVQSTAMQCSEVLVCVAKKVNSNCLHFLIWWRCWKGCWLLPEATGEIASESFVVMLLAPRRALYSPLFTLYTNGRESWKFSNDHTFVRCFNGGQEEKYRMLVDRRIEWIEAGQLLIIVDQDQEDGNGLQD